MMYVYIWCIYIYIYYRYTHKYNIYIYIFNVYKYICWLMPCLVFFFFFFWTSSIHFCGFLFHVFSTVPGIVWPDYSGWGYEIQGSIPPGSDELSSDVVPRVPPEPHNGWFFLKRILTFFQNIFKQPYLQKKKHIEILIWLRLLLSLLWEKNNGASSKLQRVVMLTWHVILVWRP